MFSHDLASANFITWLLVAVMASLALVGGGTWLWASTHRQIRVD